MKTRALIVGMFVALAVAIVAGGLGVYSNGRTEYTKTLPSGGTYSCDPAGNSTFSANPCVGRPVGGMLGDHAANVWFYVAGSALVIALALAFTAAISRPRNQE